MNFIVILVMLIKYFIYGVLRIFSNEFGRLLKSDQTGHSIRYTVLNFFVS
jgi:hypothetical protein